MRVVSLQDFVIQVEDLLDAPSCADIIRRFDADPHVREGLALHADRGAEVNDDKVCRDLAIPREGDWLESFDRIHEAVSTAIAAIVPNFPSLQVYPLGSTGYKIQMYPKGVGRFAWHFDALGPASQSRVLALVLYLNDVAEGGETSFFHQELDVVPRAGRAVFFPTAWTHMHCGAVPVSGPKYVVSSFFAFQGMGG